MGQESKEGELTNQQKYFLCFQCCFWAYQIIVIALGLTILGITVIGYQNGKAVLASNQYAHAQQTVQFWKMGYIIDIKAENTNNCPEGYDPMINYVWPGTIDGCYCSSSANNYNFEFVLSGKCSSNLISLGCQNVNPMPSQTLNMWKGGILLCIKRASSMNFYKSVMTSAPSGGTSPNMTVCAANSNYQVYTLPGVDCPLTGLSNNSLGSTQTQLLLDSINKYYINFISQTSYPIVDLKLTEYQYCQFFNQINISPNKQGTYILGQQTVTTPCTVTDPRMNTIDSLNEEDFYTNNTQVFQLIEQLPAYPKPSIDYQYLLGYIPYPTWTFSCRNSANFNLYVATTHILFTDSWNSLVVTASVIVPCLLVLVLLFRTFFIIRHIIDLKSRNAYRALMLSQDEIIEQIPNINIKKSFRKELVIFLLEVLILLAVFFGLIYSIVNLTNDSVWIKQINKYGCTDTYLYNIFLYYEDVIDQTSTLLIQCSFVWGILFIIHIIYFAVRNEIGDLFSKKEIVVEEIPSESIEPVDILEKQGNLEGVNMQDSSDIAFNKEKNSQIKIYDVDYLMGEGGGQTKDNFFNPLEREASMNIIKKKKKKKIVQKKKRNLFREDQ